MVCTGNRNASPHMGRYRSCETDTDTRVIPSHDVDYPACRDARPSCVTGSDQQPRRDWTYRLSNQRCLRNLTACTG